MPNYNQPYQPRGHGGGNRDNVKLQPASPVKFYVDDGKTILNPELVSLTAEEQAEKIRGSLNSAQLRRFFGEIKDLYHRWKNENKSKESFERIFPLIRLMNSKIYYAINPKKPKIPNEFAAFMLGGLSQIKDKKDFEAFVMYFEAVVGFMYGKGLVSK